MIRVRIPPALRTETDGSREVEIAGETVGDVLDALVQAFRGLDGRLLRDGAIQPFLTVYLDGTDVRGLEGSATHVQPGSTLLLLPAMAGGSQMSHGTLTPRVSLPRRRTATRRGRIPALVWRDFMAEALADVPIRDFPAPRTFTGSSESGTTGYSDRSAP